MISPSNRFFLKLSCFIFLLLFVIGGAYVLISAYLEEDYRVEVNQQLYDSIAEHTVGQVTPLVDGRVDTTQIQDIMHSMMVINPSIEVYLLLPDGKIITHIAPNSRVQVYRVDLDRRNIFSAAEVRNTAGVLEGYLYIILSGDEQQAVSSRLYTGHVTRLGAFLFFLSLLTAFAAGIVGLRYLTRHLRHVIDMMQRFREGDHGARIGANARGEFAPVAATFNDMADTIAASMEEMKSVDHLRRELIANISHDLRTPLAIIQGFVETLAMKNETMSVDQRQKYLATVLGGTERLNKLIDQFFDYSKLEARQILPNKEAFNPGELAQDMVHKFGLLAARKNIRVELELPRDLPLIFADLALVERVLDNLIDNALKFTPAGGRICLKMVPAEGSVEITVSDTGPGIPQNELPYVFDRFRQVDRSGSITQAGGGLGLAIVKKILELHDQPIRITSRLCEGSSFIFNMPVIT